MSTLRSNILVQPQEIYTSSSTQGADLGALATTGDGRYFRYVKAGATSLVAGQVYQGPANSNANWCPVGGLGVGQAVATGQTSFTVSASITLGANDLAGGVMSVAVTPGQGQSYKVKSNSAVSSATGAAIVLEDPLVTNLSVASRVVFYPNVYNGIVVVGTTPTAPIVGVAVYPVTNAQFGWVQSRGLASVLIGSTAAPGQQVASNALNGTTGAVGPATGSYGLVGIAVATANIAEYDLIQLTID